MQDGPLSRSANYNDSLVVRLIVIDGVPGGYYYYRNSVEESVRRVCSFGDIFIPSGFSNDCAVVFTPGRILFSSSSLFFLSLIISFA